MGVRELRDAFNDAAQGQATCQQCLLGYDRHGDVEWQILTFSGIGADGQPFTVKSDRIRPGSDVTMAARQTATDFVQKQQAAKAAAEQGKPTT